MMKYSTELEQLGIIYSKRIFLVHIITNYQQMANKLLHVLLPYKVSKITQDSHKNYTYLEIRKEDHFLQ